MSASSKKKLRSEERTAKLTERQLTEQKEAKKLTLMTRLFVVVLAVIVVAAAWVGITRGITNSGIREKNTVAYTVGSHEISNAEMNYFYVDSVNNFANTYGSYAAMFGLDLTKPLNEQYVDEEAGLTWADDFMSSAVDSAKSIYALYDAAIAAGHVLTEDEAFTVDTTMSNMQTYATLYNYSDIDTYLKAMYGAGASEEGFRAYFEMNALATSYYNAYEAGLTYDDAAIRAADAASPNTYNAYSYNYYSLSASKFLTGGTEDEEGNVTYSDEERAAAIAAAEAAAKEVVGAEIKSVADLDAAIAALAVNAEVENASSTTITDAAFDSVLGTVKDWVTDASRKVGDVTYVKNASVTLDEEGNETETINGYYVVMFTGMNDNSFALKNVRHILAGFEGGTYDSNTGVTTYSDEEKAAAKEEAEALLNGWKSGEATEEAFAALANEKSDDGDGTTGGLYENVYPGQMVTAFNDWCFDASRKAGDTDIVETEYGYHVMYFVGDSEISYRDSMIEKDLRAADADAWYTALLETYTVVEGDTQYIPKDLVISAG